MTTRLLRAAMKLVPREWRGAVAHDLDEEPTSDARRAGRAVAIGARLRLARAADILAHPRANLRVTPMRDFTRDIRFAVRSAMRRPAYSLTVIATLAIGIGANTAIFSLFNWVLFRPIPGAARPSELVTILFQNSGRQAYFWVSYRDYADLRDGVPAFASVAASAPRTVDVALPGRDAERTDTEIVSTNYFAMFGVRVAPGRDFRSEEERPSPSTPPAIISYAMWKRRFDKSPAAIGQTLTVNGHAFTIVGIAPRTFQGRSLIVATDVWVPVGAHPQMMPNVRTDVLSDRRSIMLGDAFGRLRPGATLAIAQEQAAAVANNTPGYARRQPGARRSIGPVLYEGIGQTDFVRTRLTTIFRLVMGAVGLLLLVACANAANLLLARSLGRRREIAVCQAIGAGRLRIVRQQLAEGLVLAAGAGLAGLALAAGLTALFDGMRVVSFLPAISGVTPDVRVVLFTIAVSIATGCLFALVPALTSSRIDLTASLKNGPTMARGGARVIRGAFTAAQVAISIVLVVCAGLFVRTLDNIRALDLGIRPDGVVSFSADPTQQGYSADRARQHLTAVLERLRGTPGIDAASFSWTTPLLNMRNETRFSVPGSATVLNAASNTVSRGYFDTMGIPMLAGRDFTDAESLPAAAESSVAIVSESLARLVSPDGRAVGSRLLLDPGEGQRDVEIIGVVGDVRGRPLTNAPEPWLYRAAGRSTWGVVHVRSAGPLSETVATIRRVGREIAPALPPYDIEPLSASVDRVLTEERLLARVSVVFAAVAALLAAVGIYGMMACAVGERMREFGIRLALGARSVRLLGLVLRSAVTVTAMGLAAGVAVAAAATRLLESRLYGVARLDPSTIAAGCAFLVTIALLASALPALRASRVDPVKSLRVE